MIMKKEMIKNLLFIQDNISDYINLIKTADEDENIEFFIIHGVEIRKIKVEMETRLKKSKQ